jgi:hypothetical protein
MKLCPSGTTLSSHNCELVLAWFLSQARHRRWYRSQIDNDEVGADRINTA